MNYKMTLEHIDKNIEKKEFENIIESFDEYSKTKKDFNIFKILNMRENSHSYLLAWLLDCKNKNEKSIQRIFFKNFVKFLIDNNYFFIDYDAAKTDITVDKYTCNNTSYNKYIDILLKSEKANFVCVIENKLDAPLNCDSNGITQLEHYHTEIENNEEFKDRNKLFLFLNKCSEKETEKLMSKCCNNNKIVYKDKDISNEKLKCLLCELGYIDIEHSDIALILYNTLKELNINEEQPKKDEKLYILEKIYEKIEKIIKTKKLSKIL